MADGAVELTVEQRVGRHEQPEFPYRLEHPPHLAQRTQIVFDMFEYIETDDRVERIGDHRRRRRAIKVKYGDLNLGHRLEDAD